MQGKSLRTTSSCKNEVCDFNNLYRAEIMKILKLNGGKLQDNFTSANTNNSNGDAGEPVRVMFLSEPSYFRREKYLLAIIAGVPLVHHSWVRACVQRGALLSLREFELPTGLSPIRPYMLFPHHWPNYEGAENSNHNSGGYGNHFDKELSSHQRSALSVFEGLRVLNLSSALFLNILTAAGASVIHRDDKQFIESLVAGETVVRGKRVVLDYIVVDSMAYCEACAQFSSNSGGQAITNSVQASKMKKKVGKASNSQTAGQKTDADMLSFHEFQLIQHVLHPLEGILSISPAVINGLKVVTVDWVTSCIQLGTFIEPSITQMFSLPTEPIQKPSVFKNAAASGGERFNIFDIVYYQCGNGESNGNAPSENRALGRILAFSRRAAGCPMQVRIEKLISGNVSNNSHGRPLAASSSNADVKLRQTKDLTPTSTLQAITQLNQPYGNHTLRRQPSDGEFLIDSSMLVSKVALLHREDFDRAQYSLVADDVFSMSLMWDRWYEHCLNKETAGGSQNSQGDDGDDDLPRSQDY
jgi:hypothetical protein